MFLSGNKPVEVKLVGNTLVAAFRNSNPNLIWKFDLERNHSFTLALQGEEGDLELGVTSPKGEFYPIARFTTREDAEEAFTAVQRILMRRKFFRIKTIAIIIILGLVFYSVIVPLARTYLGNSSPISASHTSANALQNRTGVPLPADQVLRPPP